MGMDATLDVWVGFNMEREDAPTRQQLAGAFPELVDQDDADPDFPEFQYLYGDDEKAFLDKHGYVLRPFENDNGLHGFGVKVHCHDGDFGPERLDLEGILGTVEELRPKLVFVFEKAGLPMQAFGVWHQTDYR